MKPSSILAQTLVLLIATVAQCQEVRGLKQLAAPLGLKIGFEISPENLFEQAYCDTVRREANVGTMTTYWHLPGSYSGIDLGRSKTSTSTDVFGTYNFSRQKLVAGFCHPNGIEIHGHPLVWALDKYTPPWVLNVKGNQAVSLLKNHVTKVVSEFKGTVRVWHVVNEAFKYDGKLADCHWNRVLGLPNPGAHTPQYVSTAFQAAALADPTAQLIYNDFGQEEVDARKFNAIIRMMVNMRNQHIPIHGLGWQMHVTASQVLDPNFPLEARLNLVANLGFDNYITELDIVMDEWNLDGSLPPPKAFYDANDHARQTAAYQKIAAIFLRSQRCVSMQFWGVSDKQSWLGELRQPLLFNRTYRKKTPYAAVRNELLGIP